MRKCLCEFDQGVVRDHSSSRKSTDLLLNSLKNESEGLGQFGQNL